MGCDKADHTTEIGSLLGNTYMFALVSSEAACEISLNNGINCAQLIEFTSSNTATVIVTDIANIDNILQLSLGAGLTFDVGGFFDFKFPLQRETPLKFHLKTAILKIL